MNLHIMSNSEEFLSYDFKIFNWTVDGFKIKLNFTDPLLVSKGLKPDLVFVEIKDPLMFVSIENG